MNDSTSAPWWAYADTIDDLKPSDQALVEHSPALLKTINAIDSEAIEHDLRTGMMERSNPGWWIPAETMEELRRVLAATTIDTESSASRQHWIETGKYLKYGEALDG